MHLSGHEVLEALEAPHCPVCRLSRLAARAYLAGVIEGGINDAALRAEWRQRGGLCARHWREARDLEAPAFPLAILSEDLLADGLARGVKPPRCPACEIETEAEARYFHALLALPLADLERALAEGRGFLCLRHWARLPQGPLRQRFRERLEGILEDLAEFQRKYDYRHSDEPMGEARDAWLRAVRALGGAV